MTIGHRILNRQFPANYEGLGEAIELVRSYLEQKGISGQKSARLILAAEESMTSLIRHAASGSKLSVSLHSLLGTIYADFSVQGEEYDFGAALVPDVSDIWAMPESDVADALRQALLRNYRDLIKYKYKNGVSTVRLTAVKSSRSFYLCLCALLSAILAGLLLSTVAPSSWNTALNGYILTPIKTMYLNALKLIAAPVVFLSIAGCISKQSNLSGLGRIGGKVIGYYMLTTVLAVAVGIGVFHLLSPGDASVAAGMAVDEAISSTQTYDISILDTIVGIVPSNFLQPFLDADMLQLIFLAVVCGIAIGRVGDYSKPLRELFDALEELFLKLAALFMRVTPVAVFCSILSLILKTGVASLMSVLGMFGTFLCGLACMAVIYSLILILSGLNPLYFFKMYGSTMLQVFSIASSNAAIPLNVEACNKKLGISPRIYSLSIPLGSTINMDGTCILMAVEALTLAKLYGVAIPGNMLVSLAVSIIVMSVGAPGVAGSGVIILSMLLTQLGVPVEGVALVMGIGPVVGMFISMCNCLGDVVISAAVAKSEKLMDMETYQKEVQE